MLLPPPQESLAMLATCQKTRYALHLNGNRSEKLELIPPVCVSNAYSDRWFQTTPPHATGSDPTGVYNVTDVNGHLQRMMNE